MKLAVALLMFSVAPGALAADHPSVEISNGPITAKLYLPDENDGYYRGNRFDWSGVIYSLTYDGHEYFGEWQQSDDPYLHDRITGPVEEYITEGKALGYDDAEVGGSFVRIGIGALIKANNEEFERFGRYEVKDHGEWFVERGPNWIEFIHELIDSESGYGYRLTKRMTLTPDQPELVIDHTLTNLGRKRLETSMYNHNFFVMDGRPTGPEFSVEFPFDITADRDLKGHARTEGSNLVYQREIPDGDNIIALLTGYSDSADDNAFTIENREAGLGVRVAGDKPLAQLLYWSPNTTLCPEPYIDLALDVAESDRWVIKYDFYTVR